MRIRVAFLLMSVLCCGIGLSAQESRVVPLNVSVTPLISVPAAPEERRVLNNVQVALGVAYADALVGLSLGSVSIIGGDERRFWPGFFAGLQI